MLDGFSEISETKIKFNSIIEDKLECNFLKEVTLVNMSGRFFYSYVFSFSISEARIKFDCIIKDELMCPLKKIDFENIRTGIFIVNFSFYCLFILISFYEMSEARRWGRGI